MFVRASHRRVAAAVVAALLAGALTAWLTRDAGEDDPRALARTASTGTTAAPLYRPLPTSSPTPTRSETGRDAIPAAGVGATVRSTPPPPTRIVVPRLDATMRVAPVGVDQRGDMVIPADPRVAGWYRFGAAPGSSSGATVIAAHVDDARYGIGPLARLGTLHRGDTVTLTAGRDELRYRVTRVLRLDKGELDTDDLFDRDGPARLHLVTCGGAFDRTTGHYEDNIVVVATPVG
ncbi:hypothetical protein GCM10027080_06860 [Pedococcus soli]